MQFVILSCEFNHRCEESALKATGADPSPDKGRRDQDDEAICHSELRAHPWVRRICPQSHWGRSFSRPILRLAEFTPLKAGLAQDVGIRMTMQFVILSFELILGCEESAPQDMKTFYVYILSNRKNGTLYIGMTNNLQRRLKEYRSGVSRGFVTKYRLTRLVYFETFGDAYSAIVREKQLKGWLRSKKIALIEAKNPEWKDLSNSSF